VGRDALRGAAELELPPERRERILASLRGPDPERRLYVSPMRLVTILAPVAAVLAIVGAIASLDGGGGDDSGGGGGEEAAQVGRDQAGGGAEEATSIPAGTLLGEVAGPPRRVARLLRAEGFEARVQGDAVVVLLDGPPPRRLTLFVARLDRGPVAVFAAST
jgi:hypothetical protein